MMPPKKRRESNRIPVDRPVWQVTIQAHRVGQYEIPYTKITTTAPDAKTAKLHVARTAHSLAGVPPSKTLLNRSYQFTTVRSHHA